MGIFIFFFFFLIVTKAKGLLRITNNQVRIPRMSLFLLVSEETSE